MTRMSMRGLGVLLLVLLLVVAGCSSGSGNTPAGSNSAPSQGNAGESSELRIGLDVDAGTLDPRLARDTSAYRITNLIFDGLVQLDENLQPQPDLATSWDNPDPTTWIFYLREDAKFHDGTPVTADDVIYTFQTLLDPDFKAPYRSLYTPIAKVESIDPQTVKFTLSEPYAPLLSYMDMGIVPKHIAEQSEGDFAANPVGSGPFKFVKWDKNNQIVVEANPDYWGGAPSIQKIVFKVVPDNTNRAQALESGDVDLIQSPLSPQDVKRLAGDDRFTTVEMTAAGFTYINLNTQDPILSDPKVRRALAMLVDQKTIIDTIYQGIDKPATSVLLPGSWAYTDAIKQPGYDPEEAVRLLNEAGWTDSDGDGILDQGGRKLSIVLATHSEDPNRIQVVEYLQNVLSQNGIDASTKVADWPSFSADVQAGNYQMALLGWLNLVDPDRAMYNQFHSGGGTNWGAYDNPEVDQLLETGRTALNREERIQAYQGAARIIAEELPYYVLSYQGYQVIYNPKLKGLVPNSRGSLRSLASATFGS